MASLVSMDSNMVAVPGSGTLLQYTHLSSEFTDLLHLGFLSSIPGPLLPLSRLHFPNSHSHYFLAFLCCDFILPGHLPFLNLTVTPPQLQLVPNSSYALSSRMIQPFASHISVGRCLRRSASVMTTLDSRVCRCYIGQRFFPHQSSILT